MKILKNFIISVTSLICLSFIMNTIVTAEEPIHPGYPYVFDVTGKLDRISNKKIVIEDTLFKLSSSTTYQTPDITFANPSDFRINDQVGIVLNNEKNEASKEVVSVWLIKKAD